MRIKFYGEVELDDAKLLEQFGERLVTLSVHELPAGFARGLETAGKTLPAVKALKVVYLPEMFPGGVL